MANSSFQRLTRQAGFGLLEALAALAILGAISLAYAQINLANQARNIENQAAEHGQVIANGVNKYINDKRPVLLSSPTPVVAGFVNPMAPTMTELQNPVAGTAFLPAGFNAANVLGMNYTVSLTLVPAGCTPGTNCTDISGLIVSTGPLTDPATGLANGVRLGNMADIIGTDAAISEQGAGTQLLSADGVWAGVPNPRGNVPGILAIRAGFGSTTYASLDSLLPRDGSRPMTGDLNMNSKSIVAVNNVTATGTMKAATITSTGDVNGDQYITAIKSVGAPCSTNGALASGSGVVMVCTGGTWQVQTGERSNVGAPCSPNGKTATSIATLETIVCRGGVYVGLSNLLARTVEVSRQIVIDGDNVPKAACPGGLPNARMIPLTWTADMAASPPLEGVYMYPQDGGAFWFAQISVFPPAPGTWQSGNVVGAKAMLINECTYN